MSDSYLNHYSSLDGTRKVDRVLVTTMTSTGPFFCPTPAHFYSYPPARYNNMLPPTPWIFRGDVNKPLFVLLAMEAPMVLAAILSWAFGL